MLADRQVRSPARAIRQQWTAHSEEPQRFSSANRSARLPARESYRAIIGIPIRKSIGTPIAHRDNFPAVSSLGERIRALRKTKGLSQVRLAQLAGIKQPSLSELETGESKVAAGDTLVRLAAALECNPDWLATGKGSPVVALLDISPDENELLAIWRSLSEQNQELLMHLAHKMVEGQPSPKPSRSRPFVKAR